MSTKNMEENLMDFSSPFKSNTLKNKTVYLSENNPFVSPHQVETHTLINKEIYSPGNNPFDTLSQIAEGGEEIFSPGRNPFDTLFQKAEAFTDGKESCHFSRLIDLDCGRESLGILQMDLEKMQFSDTNWLNVPEIQVNNQDILQFSPRNMSSQLNTAFLYSYRSNNKTSISSSIPSSVSSFPESLEMCDLSKIHCINSFINGANLNSLSVLNKAFFNGNDHDSNIKSTLNEKTFSIVKDELKQSRRRIHSLPNILQSKDEEINSIKDINLCQRNFQKSESLFKKSFNFSQMKLEKIDVEDEDFNDSVFIEAKHIASKIADNSILDAANGELYSLDCIPEPEWIKECDAIDGQTIVNKTEEVFKSIDQMVAPLEETAVDKDNKVPNSEYFLENTNKSNTSKSSNDSNSLNRSECFQNLSEILHGDNRKLSTSRISHCSNSSKSRDAKSILHNLSEILSNENPSVQQKTEGQNLLYNLADILCSSDNRISSHDREQSEDSGHSSIDQDILPRKQEDIDYVALDLRVNTEASIEEFKPLDLSVTKNKSPSILNNSIPKLEEANCEIITKSKICNNTSVQGERSKNESTYSNDSRNLTQLKTRMSEVSSFGKLKPKKIDKKVIPQKGPLKAVIPIGSMSKSGINRSKRITITPPKKNPSSTASRLKRTSTPKSENKPQPVAQSTPDGTVDLKRHIPISVHLRQRKSEGPVSPLTRNNSRQNESTEELNKQNQSRSASNLSSCASKNASLSSSQIMFRRRSASDLKPTKNTVKFKRSNTIDKDSGITKTLNRVRENIEKSKNSVVDKNRSADTKIAQNKSILGKSNRSSTSSVIKPCNLVNKLRKTNGKENIPKYKNYV